MKYRVMLARPMLAAVEEAASLRFDALLADHILTPGEIAERAHAGSSANR